MVLAPVSYHPSTDCWRSLLRRLEAAAAASALESENRQLREILERALGQQRAAAILPPAATRPEDRGQKEPRTKPHAWTDFRKLLGQESDRQRSTRIGRWIGAEGNFNML